MVEARGVATRKPLGQMLLDGAFISREQLEAALPVSRATGRRMGEVLVEQHAIAPETLATMLSFQLNVPIIDLKQFKIQPEAVARIPEELAREHNVLALALEGDTLTVAMDEPQDLQTIDLLAARTGLRIRPVIPLHGGIREAVNSQYRLTGRIEEQVREATQAASRTGRAEPIISQDVISQAPIVRVVEMLINQAVKDRASDIHIEPQEEGLRVRNRIDGILHEVAVLPAGVQNALLSRIKVMANMNIAERRRPQDGQFSMRVGEKVVDFRVATIESNHGEMVVLRVLDKEMSVRDLGELGLSPVALETYRRVLQSAFGMVMISGPTGSGKTTTLYASVNTLDSASRNVMTIEDPIEYRFKNINQIQVNRQADITFATGLRALMRLDPDVILVGEIRDAETASTAVQAALTGHLVLTSIHANDSVGAISRILDLGVEPFLVTSGVIAAVAQRLVRKVCPYCQATLPAPPGEIMAYQQEMQEMRTEFTYGRGCNFCSHTGFLGRVAVYEVLPMTESIRTLVTREAPASEIRVEAVRQGMITMRRDGMQKARDGITTPGEVVRSVFTIV